MIAVEMCAIPHTEQRYDTLGDWFERDGVLQIRASQAPDPRYEMLVAIHELIEATLCAHRGITEAAVDAFDLSWDGSGEPGDDRAAPYYREHQFATSIERLMAHELGVDWNEYEAALDRVMEAT